MKYIRTENNIYEKNKYREITCFQFDNEKRETGYKRLEIPTNSPYMYIYENIINEADTIEELCDEFVVVGLDSHRFMQIDFIKENYSPNLWDIYGAIWTDKGLLYIAKLNEDGELELL